MEAFNDFDLNHSVTRWCQELALRESIRPEDAAELESHLRDSIHRLTSTGLSEPEAFLVATHRLGRPDELSVEFGKVNGTFVWRRRILWMAAGAIAFPLLQGLATVAANLTLLTTVALGVNGYTAGSSLAPGLAADGATL